MKALIASTLILAATPAAALTGNEMLALVKTPHGELVLTGYMQGIGDAEVVNISNARRARAALHFEPFCIPETATVGQSVAIVKKHMADHPQSNHLAFYAIARTALLDAWPCPQSR